MTRRKDQSREMTAPDEFQKRAVGFYSWMYTHQQKIYMGVAAVVLVCAIGVTVNYLVSQKRLRRLDDVSAIDVALEQEKQRLEEQKQSIQSELSAMRTKLSAAQSAKPETKEFLTPAQVKELEDKIAAASARRDGLVLNSRDIRQNYFEFYQANKGEETGRRAAVQAIMLDIETKDFDAAKKLAAELLAEKAKTPFYQVQVRLVYIGLLEQTGEGEQALAQARLLRDSADQDFLPRGLLVAAGVEKRFGDLERARNDLQRIQDEFPDSPEAVKAGALKSILETSSSQ